MGKGPLEMPDYPFWLNPLETGMVMGGLSVLELERRPELAPVMRRLFDQASAHFYPSGKLPPAFSAIAERDGERVIVTVYASTDPGPMREFKPIFGFELDEAHVTELLCTLRIAQRELVEARS